MNLNNLFYGISRLAHLSVEYNATQLNCDVMLTVLMTGWTNWSIIKKFHRAFTKVSLPLKKGTVNHPMLEELTEENSLL